ncbi:MAG: hypothetical protein K1Y36_29790 [Blastocatellia bacterium]|nr:hypothetical protein [Blastocatellia bacterium]
MNQGVSSPAKTTNSKNNNPAKCPSERHKQEFFRSPDADRLFWAAKPESVSFWDWLFHPANPYRFPPWIELFLLKVDSLARKLGKTFCHQDYLADIAGKSDRWVREILQRLEAIGVLETTHDSQNRHRLNPAFRALRFSCTRAASNHVSSHASTENQSQPAATPVNPNSCREAGSADMKSMTCSSIRNHHQTGDGPTVKQVDDKKPVARQQFSNPKRAIGKENCPEQPERQALAAEITTLVQELHRLGARPEPIHNPGGYQRKLIAQDLEVLRTALAAQQTLLTAAQRKQAVAVGPGLYQPTDAAKAWETLSDEQSKVWIDRARQNLRETGQYQGECASHGLEYAEMTVNLAAFALYERHLNPPTEPVRPAFLQWEDLAAAQQTAWLDYTRRELAKTEQFQQVVAERGAEYAEFDVVLAACELYGHHQGDFSRLGR